MDVVAKIWATSILFQRVLAMSADRANAARASMISAFRVNGTAHPK